MSLSLAFATWFGRLGFWAVSAKSWPHGGEATLSAHPDPLPVRERELRPAYSSSFQTRTPSTGDVP